MIAAAAATTANPGTVILACLLCALVGMMLGILISYAVVHDSPGS